MDNDQYEMGEGDNFHFALDKSGSMQANDCTLNGKKVDRLTAGKAKGLEFIHAGAEFDKDGTTILAFGSDVQVYDNVTPQGAEAIFAKIKAMDGSTRTDLVIQKSYDLHKAGGYKQTVLFLLTDGEPTGNGSAENSREAVKTVIRNIASELAAKAKEKGEDDNFGYAISFVTCGKPSEELTAFLTDIDDNLNAAIDIVDVKPLEKIGTLAEAFAGALFD